MSTLLLLIAIGASIALASLASSGCASWRQRTANGFGALLDCEGAHLDAGLLAEAKSLSTAAIQKWISGDGHVDRDGIKAEAAPLKSDLMRCGFVAAVVAIATPTPKQPGAPQAAELEVDGPGLLAAFATARGELGWQPVRIAEGKVL